MSLDIGLGRSPNDSRIPIRLQLDADGYYWFLYAYFEKANLRPDRQLLDLYDDSEIGGRQLDRLEEELVRAKADVASKEESWNELIGWSGIERKRSQEMREKVERRKMLILIEKLLALISEARERQLKLIGIGD